MYRFCVIQLIS